MSQKRTIIKGEDRVLNLDVIRKSTSGIKRPFNLTGWTRIAVQFKKYNGGVLEIDNLPAHARASTGTYGEVTYTADVAGIAGDSITLTFDGAQSISDVISAWNLANSGNEVSSDATDETVIPPAGSITLSGGLDAYSKVSVIDEVQGKISVNLDNEDTNSLKLGPGQGLIVVIDFGEHDLGSRRKAAARNIINVDKSTL